MDQILEHNLNFTDVFKINDRTVVIPPQTTADVFQKILDGASPMTLLIDILKENKCHNQMQLLSNYRQLIVTLLQDGGVLLPNSHIEKLPDGLIFGESSLKKFQAHEISQIQHKYGFDSRIVLIASRHWALDSLELAKNFPTNRGKVLASVTTALTFGQNGFPLNVITGLENVYATWVANQDIAEESLTVSPQAAVRAIIFDIAQNK